MVENTNQATVVINHVIGVIGFTTVRISDGEGRRTIRTLVQTFTLRGHRVCRILNNKLVVALQHALGMFSGEHPAIF